MSEIPQPERLSAPEATPDTLHDVALAAWQNNLDAVRDDTLPYGGQSLRLYPTASPRDSILVFPVMGHESMNDGTFRMMRTRGSRVVDMLDVMTTAEGKRLINTVVPSDLPSATELSPTTEDAVAEMQEAIAGASTVRPVGKIARILGRLTSN
jgi:hypothetical protein